MKEYLIDCFSVYGFPTNRILSESIIGYINRKNKILFLESLSIEHFKNEIDINQRNQEKEKW